MAIYIIFALSFAIMYWWSYTREIIKTVQGVEKKLNDSEIRLNPGRYSTRMFLLSFLIAPWYVAEVIASPKWQYIKIKSTNIIRKQYALAIAIDD